MKSLKVLFAAGFVVGSLVGGAEAIAGWRSYPGQACSTNEARGQALGVSTISGPTLANYLSAYCPVPDDNPSARFSNATGLTVSVYDSSTTAYQRAQACVTYYGSLGGSCGSFASSGTSAAATGNYSISPSRSSWTTYPDEYAYVYVELSGVTGSPSYVKGYYTSF